MSEANLLKRINYSYVGRFLGYSLIHPLSNCHVIKKEDDPYIHNCDETLFLLDKNEDIFLKIEDLDGCVINFLAYMFFTNEMTEDDLTIPWRFQQRYILNDKYKNYAELMRLRELKKYDNFGSLFFKNVKISADNIELISDFSKKVKKKFNKVIHRIEDFDYITYPKIHDIDERKYISIMLGEYIYFSARHLLTKDFSGLLLDVERVFKGAEFKIEPYFYAVKVLPSNYPCTIGHYFSKQDKSEDSLVKGFRFEEERIILDKLAKNK